MKRRICPLILQKMFLAEESSCLQGIFSTILAIFSGFGRKTNLICFKIFRTAELPGRTEGSLSVVLSESVDIFLKSVERQGQREQDVRVSR